MFGFSSFSEFPFSTIAVAYVPPPPPIVVVDTHDGDGKRKKKKFDEEVQKNRLRKQQIIDAFEVIIEGRPELAEDLAEEHIEVFAKSQPQITIQKINFESFIQDIDKVEKLFRALQELDDEEVLLLL